MQILKKFTKRTPDHQNAPIGNPKMITHQMLMKIKNDNAVVDEDHLNAFIAKASKTCIDAEVWLDEIRGGYDE